MKLISNYGGYNIYCSDIDSDSNIKPCLNNSIVLSKLNKTKNFKFDNVYYLCSKYENLEDAKTFIDWINSKNDKDDISLIDVVYGILGSSGNEMNELSVIEYDKKLLLDRMRELIYENELII